MLLKKENRNTERGLDLVDSEGFDEDEAMIEWGRIRAFA